MFETKLERAPIAALKPHARNARTHSNRQIQQIADSIQRFGFTNPVLIDDDFTIIAGHGRVEAAKLLGMDQVPVLRLSHLNETERRAYVIADNRLAEKAGWDRDILAIELQALTDLNFEIGVIGFETAEIDHLLETVAEADPSGRDMPEDLLPAASQQAVTKPRDIWELGRHRLICADACDPQSYQALMGEDLADVLFTDPPYNVPIQGFVGGNGQVKHQDFAMGVGEMSAAEFEGFLHRALTPAAQHMKDRAIGFVCMDWRHMGELLRAGASAFDELKNLCVWTKTNGGMGSPYRSQHELVFVFKRGTGAHANNVELGRFGRNRTNVWSYAGANAFGAARDAELAMHPTVKPVARIVDALKDVSARGAIVLDCFGGSGSTLIAAEKCGRSARLIELDAGYCDVIAKRFQAYAGKPAHLAGHGATFDELEVQRGAARVAC